VDALTVWSVQWEYTEEITGDMACTVINARVNSNAIVILPHWTDPQTAPYAYIQRWREYMEGISRHEANHVRLLQENVGRITEAILRSDCADAERAAQTAYNEIVEIEDDYDRETEHGRLEGIQFPI
jgi:predicted secreted Zn-dependent protease